MRIWFRRLFWHLVDILSMLALPPEKERALEFGNSLPDELNPLKTAIRLLKESARRFREWLWFLKAARCYFGYWLRNLASSICARSRLLLHISAAQQARWSDAKNGLVY